MDASLLLSFVAWLLSKAIQPINLINLICVVCFSICLVNVGEFVNGLPVEGKYLKHNNLSQVKKRTRLYFTHQALFNDTQDIGFI